MSNATNRTDKPRISAIIGAFIQKNRVVLASCLGAALAGLVIIAIVAAVSENLTEKAVVRAEDFSRAYDELSAEKDEGKKDAGVKELVEDLRAFSLSARGFPKARAFAVLASIQSDRKEWADAAASWLSSADALPKSYLAPIGVYNAAVCAEESGDNVKALELYQRCADTYGKDFALAPRALFAIGRIGEQSGNSSAAIAAYQKILDTWPSDENWTKLANGRILFISSRSGK